jgi:hypothetical protein
VPRGGLPSDPEAFGPYRVEREIARGGMGAVYEVVHTQTQARYALKTLLPGVLGESGIEELERFRREAEVMGKLRHAHVGQVHAAELTGDRPYLVQDLLTGGTLRDRVLGGELTIEGAVTLMLQLADGLGHCHQRGVVHRDLKPANVLIDEHGQAKLVDFGLALTLSAARKLTVSGAVMGTPGFMAPEQANGERADAQTDVYGLGAILYFVLCRRAPFVGANAYGIIGKVLTQDPEPPVGVSPDVPRWLSDVCLRALSKAPDARYADMAAFTNALASGPGRRSSRTSPRVAVAAVLALGLVAGATGLALTQEPAATVRSEPEVPDGALPADPVQSTPSVAEDLDLAAIEDPIRRLDAANRWLETYGLEAPRSREIRRERKRVVSAPLRVATGHDIGTTFFLTNERTVSGGFTRKQAPVEVRDFRLVQPVLTTVSGELSAALAVSRDFKRFAFARGLRVVIVDADGNVVSEATLESRVLALAFAATGETLFAGLDKPGVIDVLSVADGTVQRSFKGDEFDSIIGLRVSPDGSQLLTLANCAKSENQVHLWPAGGGAPRVIEVSAAYTVAFAPNGEFAIGYKTGQIKRFNSSGVKQGSLIVPGLGGRFGEVGHRAKIKALRYTADGKHLFSVASSASGSAVDLRVWNLQTNALVGSHLEAAQNFLGVDLSPNRDRLLVARREGTGLLRRIEIWSIEKFIPR